MSPQISRLCKSFQSRFGHDFDSQRPLKGHLWHLNSRDIGVYTREEYESQFTCSTCAYILLHAPVDPTAEAETPSLSPRGSSCSIPRCRYSCSRTYLADFLAIGFFLRSQGPLEATKRADSWANMTPSIAKTSRSLSSATAADSTLITTPKCN